jgi:hypothetical protein
VPRLQPHRTDQQSDKDHTAARDGDPTDQDEFTAALDPGGEVINLCAAL